MKTVLDLETLNERAKEVFELREDDFVYDVEVSDDNVVTITIEETGTKIEGFRRVIFDYKPDMSERPEALEYLLGLRDNFND